MTSSASAGATIKITTILLVFVAFAGCFSQATKEEYFYSITVPAISRSVGAGPRVAINEFLVAAGYNTTKIAYRTRPNELGYYGARQWVSEPAVLIAESVIRLLRQQGKFQQVDRLARVEDPQIVVDATVEAIEQVDADGHWQGRLAMTITARRVDNNTYIGRHAFDRSLKCERNHPEAVATAISKILREEITQLAVKLTN